MFEINIYVESCRDRKTENVFWYSTLEWKGHDGHILRMNGIHSIDDNSSTSTDGGVLEAIACAMENMPENEEYQLNIITKRNRSELKKIFSNLKLYNNSNWKTDVGIYEKEIPDAFPMKRIFNRLNEIKAINIISDPQNKIVQDMEEMANVFKNLYLIESDREREILNFKKYKMESLDF